VASRLRRELEKRAGLEECEFIVPHILLPPRFRREAEGRNMVLYMDLDYVVHVRWEGDRLEPHHEMTPGGIKRLLRDVNKRITQYRQDLGVVGRFLGGHAEKPFWDPRQNYREDEEQQQALAAGEEQEVTASIKSEEGGESEIMWDFNW